MNKFFFIVVFLTSNAWIFSQGIGQGGALEVFNQGNDARISALGNAYVGLAKGSSTIAWNQAGLGELTQQEAVATYSLLFSRAIYTYLGYAYPTYSIGTFGVGITSLFVNDIEEVGNNFLSLGTINHFRMKFLVGYGYQMKKLPIAYGGALKMDFFSLGDNKSLVFNLDLSVKVSMTEFIKRKRSNLFLVRSEWLIGVTAKNLLSFQGHKLDSEFDTDPIEFVFGTSYGYEIIPKKYALTFVIDGGYGKEAPGLLAMGLENAIFEDYFVRFGYRLFGGFHLGAGAKFERKKPDGGSYGFNVDYSFELKSTEQGVYNHNFTLGSSFGKTKAEIKKKKDKEVQSKIDQAVSLFEKEKEKEIALLKKEQEEKELRLITSASNRVEAIRLETESKVNALNLSNQAMVDSLTNIIASNRENYDAEVNQLRSQHSQEVQKIIVGQKNKEKLYGDAIASYSDKDYVKALERFKRLKELDPENEEIDTYINLVQSADKKIESYSAEVIALYRSGIRSYLEKDYVKAISLWEELLKIDPYNSKAIDGIKKAKTRIRSRKKDK